MCCQGLLGDEGDDVVAVAFRPEVSGRDSLRAEAHLSGELVDFGCD
jgi:hypothetical protein